MSIQKNIKLFGRAVCKLLLVLFIVLPLAGESSYVVQRGDTLYSIARRYELTVGELRTANNFSESDVLKAGQRLVIPQADISSAVALTATPQPQQAASSAPQSSGAQGGQYTVQKGDTLYAIALKYDMKLSQLLSINNMASGAVIKVGQKLQVGYAPSSDAPSQSTPSRTSTDESNRAAVNSKKASSSAAEKKSTPVIRGDSNLLWPVQNPSVTYVKGKVSGVDLTAQNKEDVKSIRSGTVMYTGLYRGYGSVIFVESKTGLIYAYTKLSGVSVNKGDYVVCGDTIGTVGSEDTGKNRLTLMVFQNGNPMDPAKAPRG